MGWFPSQPLLSVQVDLQALCSKVSFCVRVHMNVYTCVHACVCVCARAYVLQ